MSFIRIDKYSVCCILCRYIIIFSHNKLVQGMSKRGREYDQNVCGFYFSFPKYIVLARDQVTAHSNLLHCHYRAQTNHDVRDIE